MLFWGSPYLLSYFLDRSDSIVILSVSSNPDIHLEHSDLPPKMVPLTELEL